MDMAPGTGQKKDGGGGSFGNAASEALPELEDVLDRFTAMRHFLAVVEGQSFSNAARRLGVANATITQSVKNLEEHLGVRLVNRSTRHMQLTSEGLAYAKRCSQLMEELESLEHDIVESAHAARGELRVEIPAALGRKYFLPKVLEFSADHPQLQTTVFLNSGSSGLVADGIDAAIQLGPLKSSALIARKIHTTYHVACAAPSFLRRAGKPRTPRDIKEADCINAVTPDSGTPKPWLFENDQERVELFPSGPLKFESSGPVIEVALLGGGIIYVPRILVVDLLKSGELFELFPDWRTLERGVYVVLPNRQNVPAKVRAFSDFAEKIFREIAQDEP